MKGSNKLEFNKATLMQAVQEYLDRRLALAAGKQIVKDVSYNGANGYTVVIEEKTQ